jgi:hypothetical protein
MVAAGLDWSTMKQDISTHLVPTWSAHNMTRSLIVALALVAAPVLAAVALSYPTLAVAFVAGLTVAGAMRGVPRLVRWLRTGHNPMRKDPLLTVGRLR